MKKQLARFGRPIVRSQGTLIEFVGVGLSPAPILFESAIDSPDNQAWQQWQGLPVESKVRSRDPERC
jgi:hypothetical protein